MSTPAVFPAPPPTANALSPAQRAHLVRTTSKLSRVLGHTPQVHDLRPWAELHIPKDDQVDNDDLVERRRPVTIATLPLSRSRMQARTRPRIPSFDASEDLPPYAYDPTPSTPPRSRSLRVHIPPLPTTPELSPDDASDSTSMSSIASAWLPDSPASSTAAPVSSFCVPSSPPQGSSKPKKPSPLSKRGLISRPLINTTRPASPPVLRLAPSFPSPSGAKSGPKRPFLAPGRAARLARLSAAAAVPESPEEEHPPVPGVMSPSFAIPSEGAVRRAKMDRLRKLLGECVPVGLVFPSNASAEDTSIPAHFDEEEEGEELITPISMDSSRRSFTPAYFDMDEYEEEVDVDSESESVLISISSECDEPQDQDHEGDADSVRAVRSPIHTPTRPLSPLSDADTADGFDEDPGNMASSIEVFEAQLAAADAQLAKVRVPFVWRRKLDVILEHE